MVIDTLLLLALPAAGKSEVRRYLAHLPPEIARGDFHLGSIIQLDDYPYVHLMRRISREQRRLGVRPVFFAGDEEPFRDPRDWLTLICLVAEDVAGLGVISAHPASAEPMLDRLAAARARAGIHDAAIEGGAALAANIAADVAEASASLPVVDRSRRDESTIVIEFARGGPAGAVPPLPHPLGYGASLPALGTAILERASILWVAADPAESRRRNRERAQQGPEGAASILHHGVPEAVMAHDYGMDDLAWLVAASPVPGTIAVNVGDGSVLLPVARLDNRVDHTSFLRDQPQRWPAEAVALLHRDLKAAFDTLAAPGGKCPVT